MSGEAKNKGLKKSSSREEDKRIERKFVERMPTICDKCGGKLYYDAMGRYRCADCKNEVLDDFGKIKVFLDENGPTPIPIIAEKTGVDPALLSLFLRKGRLEIPEGSKIYIKCEKCGCAIRYGRYCPECIKSLADGIKAVFNEDMGERPKKVPESDSGARMRFMNREDR